MADEPITKEDSSSSNCGGDLTAQAIFEYLSKDNKFKTPEIDFDSDDFKLPPTKDNELYQKVKSLTIEDLTTKVVNGTGAFDCLMSANNAHLSKEYSAGRITGNNYSQVYLGTLQSTMQFAVQFLLGKDQAYWGAVQVQMAARKAEIDAIVARVQLEIAKLQYSMAAAQLQTEQANYALTKMKIATEDANYCNLKAQNRVILEQYNNLVLQGDVLKEQIETARAQTCETRTDGTPITGLSGAQIMLYKAQKTAYERDTEFKFTKMMVDYWIAQKGIDEGLKPPTNMNNDMIDDVVAKTRTKIGGI